MLTGYKQAMFCCKTKVHCNLISRCSSAGKDEEDFRPLFENFLQDLLLMLNKPEWPAAEVLLTLLGKLLVCVLLIKAHMGIMCIHNNNLSCSKIPS